MDFNFLKSLGFTGIVLLSVGASATNMKTTAVSLNVDKTVSRCTFDRTQADSFRVGDNTIMGSFAIQCKEGSPPFRMNTSLSPFATVELENGGVQDISWYVRKNGPACNGDVIDDAALALHSGNRSDELNTYEERSIWSYCVTLEPQAPHGKTLKEPDAWPLQGELFLTLTDLNSEWKVPDYASRMFVRFANNSSVISKDMEQMINTLFINIGNPSDYEVQLHAHTSLIGDESYNRDLSIMRLKNVREYIIEHLGVNINDTWGQAWGETRPGSLASKSKDEAFQNRRVDIVITPKKM